MSENKVAASTLVVLGSGTFAVGIALALAGRWLDGPGVVVAPFGALSGAGTPAGTLQLFAAIALGLGGVSLLAGAGLWWFSDQDPN